MFSFYYILLAIIKLSGQSNLFITNAGINITYNLDSSCNLLFTATTTLSVKCLILCQTIMCQSLQYDQFSNTCTLVNGQPNRIVYDSLPDLSIVYKLGKLFTFILV